jgi:hypothetical protein
MTTGVLTGCTLGGSDAELADHSRTTLDEHQILALLAAQHNASDYEFKSPPVLSAAVDATVLDVRFGCPSRCFTLKRPYGSVTITLFNTYPPYYLLSELAIISGLGTTSCPLPLCRPAMIIVSKSLTEVPWFDIQYCWNSVRPRDGLFVVLTRHT